MAGFIRFSDSQRWSSSNWVFRGVMDHLIDTFVAEPAVTNCVEICKSHQLMDFPRLYEESPEFAAKILPNLKTVSALIVEGKLTYSVNGQVADDTTQVQFCEAAKELVDMMREIQKGDGDGRST